jgi:hypothetical protein
MRPQPCCPQMRSIQSFQEWLRNATAPWSAAVKATGFGRMALPRQTIARAPDGKETQFRRATVLRAPLGSNVIVADFQSLIPAALVTLFGIGAELGILGVC